ncbi:hypothetical protein GGR51DRAFT_564986 [Nemania sp. FL0031]|nr:hypothetical protein GGR51DRAFT_564986 [Nemania sp. FL0031]
MAVAQNRNRPPENGRVDYHDHHLRNNITGKEAMSSVRRNFAPEFWDNLSKVPLTARALREVDRRNDIHLRPPKPWPGIFSGSIARFARHGGPNILDLRGYPARTLDTDTTSDSEMAKTTKKSSASSHGREFEIHLNDHGIYLNNRKSKPRNVQEIINELERPLPSLLGLSKEAFEDFQDKHEDVDIEDDVMRGLVPALCGNTNILSKQNVLFTELTPITNEFATKPKPDFFDGCRLSDINRTIRNNQQMYPMIIPTKYLKAPVAPNFILEAKREDGDAAVLKRQACYYGAYGARAMHSLQNYCKKEPVYDGNAYALSATYNAGSETLWLYAHHITVPTSPGRRPEYHMTKLGGYTLTSKHQNFIEGVTAFRNARDLAKRYRDGFVKAANALGNPTNETVTRKKRGRPKQSSAREGRSLEQQPQQKKRKIRR